MSASVRCSFYDKVGACRHGPLCSRRHVKPQRSNTVVFWKLFDNPQTEKEREEFELQQQQRQQQQQQQSKTQQLQFKVLDKDQLKQYVDDFFTDLIVELDQYGDILEVAMCCNRNAHLTGNVYVRFSKSDSAQRCVDNCNDKWFDGKPIYCELSPVSDINEACCGEYLRSARCSRGALCNFMHIRLPSRERSLKIFEALQNKDKKSF